MCGHPFSAPDYKTYLQMPVDALWKFIDGRSSIAYQVVGINPSRFVDEILPGDFVQKLENEGYRLWPLWKEDSIRPWNDAAKTLVPDTSNMAGYLESGVLENRGADKWLNQPIPSTARKSIIFDRDNRCWPPLLAAYSEYKSELDFLLPLDSRFENSVYDKSYVRRLAAGMRILKKKLEKFYDKYSLWADGFNHQTEDFFNPDDQVFQQVLDQQIDGFGRLLKEAVKKNEIDSVSLHLWLSESLPGLNKVVDGAYSAAKNQYADQEVVNIKKFTAYQGGDPLPLSEVWMDSEEEAYFRTALKVVLDYHVEDAPRRSLAFFRQFIKNFLKQAD